MRQVLLRYCGDCNPEINLNTIIREIKEGLPADIEFVAKATDHAADLGIMMVGCTHNCLDREEIWILAKQWITVCSNYINLFPVENDTISAQVIKKIMECLPDSDGES